MSSSHVQVAPDGTGKDIDADAVVSTESGTPTVYRQDVVVADPSTYSNKAGVTPSGTLQVGGPTTDNATPATALYPVVVAGEDNAGLVRAVLTDAQGTLFVLHRFEVFDEILAELRKHTLILSQMIGEDFTDAEV